MLGLLPISLALDAYADGLGDPLALVVIAVGAAPLARDTLVALRQRRYALDYLALLAIAAAVAAVEFRVGAVIALLLASGQALEDYGVRRARSSLRLAYGRLEERTLLAVAAPPDLGWPGARQVLRLARRVVSKRTGEVLLEETVYALASLRPEQASPAELLDLWQRHWQVESLHWLRDVVFGEDHSTTRTGHAPQALAAFRNLAISLIHRWHGSQVTAAREYYASHRPCALDDSASLRPDFEMTVGTSTRSHVSFTIANLPRNLAALAWVAKEEPVYAEEHPGSA